MIYFSKSNFIVKVNSLSKIFDIQHQLQYYDQFIPIGSFDIDFTIKEIIDYKLFGGFVEKFGNVENWVLNMGVEINNDNLILGADVIKNVSGYNLSRLLVGARGELGKISWVTFKTLPIRKKPDCNKQILNGFRIVIIPEFFSKIILHLEKYSIQYLVYGKIAVIDVKSNTDLINLNKYIKIKYKLIDGIPYRITPEIINKNILKRIKSNFTK